MIKKVELKRVVFEFENGYIREFSGLEVRSVLYSRPGTLLNQHDRPNAVELSITLSVKEMDNQAEARKLLRLAHILRTDSYAIQIGNVGLATKDYDIELEEDG